MNLVKILELQEAYISAAKFQEEYNKAPICVEYNQVKEKRSALKDEANSYIAAINNQYKQLAEANNKFKAINDKINEALEEKYQGLPADQLAYMAQSLESDMGALNGISNEVMKLNMALSDSIKKLNAIMGQFAAIDAKRNELKAKKEKFDTEEVMPKMNDLKDKIKAVRDSMNPSDVALYEETRNIIQKPRVVVPLREQNCGGCGLELNATAFKNVIEDGYAKCPSCGRIVFKQQ